MTAASQMDCHNKSKAQTQTTLPQNEKRGAVTDERGRVTGGENKEEGGEVRSDIQSE